ncbi:Ser-Thr-rich glycosyl-phosphatidyl-inositol-anchored membrane family [Carpediemonas membranifera]|uniref:Ser-Thr-rich glycosyl-phosphatidyl-inositol-anchored membrane family n=1 Tax=Carpediemonas membranifera TaxID=201153 RepID=A0A8J6DYG0_9EUKA|nr:Ser-Thr-rich glycosyl-phosphatidyl-inositol-anchored membrane family [Carpediemonas membranifera]|eukprot:KAG9392169.1 Ser-Thr-rich glycosyl-phosphatidyl-inositol-anchored membrane family [Carpediemonas membranifera]
MIARITHPRFCAHDDISLILVALPFLLIAMIAVFRSFAVADELPPFIADVGDFSTKGSGLEFTDPDVVDLPPDLLQSDGDLIPLEELATNFSYRDNPCRSEILDQGGCGSCWSAVTAVMLNDRFCLESNGTLRPRISAEFHIQCDHQCAYGVCNNGCDGGHYFSSLTFTNKYGATTEACYPAQSHSTPYEYDCKAICPGTPLGAPIPRYMTGELYRVTGEKAMANELVAHGPIPVAIRLYSGLYTLEPGQVYVKTDNEIYRGGHAVVIVGYGVTSDGVKYWECANSWGPNYCDQGYFWIRRGSNELSIESYPCGVAPILTAQITVTAPASGDALIVGKGAGVEWTISGHVPETVVIKLVKGTKTVATLAEAAPNTGSFAFTVPGVAVGADYAVSVICEAAQGKSAVFTVTAEFTATVTAPKAGDIIETGATISFSWTISPTSAISLLPPARLSLAGPVNLTLGTSLPLDKDAATLLPLSIPEGDYVVRLTIGDSSFDSGKFEIQIGGKKTITVGKMSASYEKGAAASVTWRVKPDSTIFDALTVTLVGPLSNGIGDSETVMGTVNNTGSFAWTPADSLADGSYFIRVASVEKPSVAGESTLFTIEDPETIGPGLRMISPTSVSVWRQGEMATVRWNTTGDVPFVTVELFNAGMLSETIAEKVVNNGSVNFTPTEKQTPADTYSVRVRQSANPTVLALSGQFIIWEPRAEPSMKFDRPRNTTIAIPGKQTLVRLVSSGGTSTTLTLRDAEMNKIANLSSARLSDGTNDVAVTIPATTAPGTYRIQAYDPATGVIANSALFTVQESVGPIDLEQPTAASIWSALADVQVRWSTADPATPMTVVLYKGSTLITVLARDVTGGVFDWRVPDLINPADGYIIRVRTSEAPYSFVDSAEFVAEADPDAEDEPLDPPEPTVREEDDDDDEEDDDGAGLSGMCAAVLTAGLLVLV